MAKFIYEVTIDGVPYEVESEGELTDAQAYQAAKVSPDAMKASREKLAAANAKPLNVPTTYGEGFKAGLAQPTTLAEHTKAAKEYGKGVALAIPDTLMGVGGALMNPSDTLAGLKQAAADPTEAVLSIATNPRALGNMTALPVFTKGLGAVRTTPAGTPLQTPISTALRTTTVTAPKVVAAAAPAAAEDLMPRTTRAVKRTLARLDDAPESAKPPKPTRAEAAAAAERARLEAAGVTPIADTAASNPVAGARPSRAPGFAQSPDQPPVSSRVTPIADELASNPAAGMPDATRSPYLAEAEQVAPPAASRTPSARLSREDQLAGLTVEQTLPSEAAVASEARFQQLAEQSGLSVDEVKSLIGNREAGAMRLAGRQGLLESLLKKARESGIGQTAERVITDQGGFIGRRRPPVASAAAAPEPSLTSIFTPEMANAEAGLTAGRVTMSPSARLTELQDIFGYGGLGSPTAQPLKPLPTGPAISPMRQTLDDASLMRALRDDLVRRGLARMTTQP